MPVFFILSSVVFFFNDPAPAEIYTLSLHDALPISWTARRPGSTRCAATRPTTTCGGSASCATRTAAAGPASSTRSEEHTSELQSLTNLVCRLLLEKKKTNKNATQQKN